MAKSGQKKAFEEETVRDDLPRKELTLSQRPAIDMTSTIQGESYRTGAFPNSAFWNDLSAISEDIHTTRRNKTLLDAQVDARQRDYESQLDAVKYEWISRSNNDILLAKRKMAFEANLRDLVEKTKREGGSVSQAVGAFRESYMQDFDSNMRLSGEFSPYAYDNLYKYVNDATERELTNAISWDYETLEVQNKAVMDTAASTALTYLYKGVDANGTPFGSVEDGMQYLGNVIGPNLKYVSERDEEALANSYYNSLVLMRANKEKDLYEADPINYPGGYQGFINNVQSLIAQYGEKRMWEFQTGEEDTDGVKSLAVALTPETITSLSSMTARTGQNKAESKAIAAAAEYDRYIDYKAISAGKYTDSEFLKRNNVDALNDLTFNYLSSLIKLAEQGNSKAVTELNKICPHYIETLSILFVKDAIMQARAEGKDVASVVSDLQTRFSKALRLSKDYNNPAGAAAMDSLIFSGSNGQTINMNLPEPGKNPLLDAYFESKGGDPDAARRNYIASLSKSALNFLEKSSLSDILLMTNSDFADGLSDVDSFTRIENITRYSSEDKKVVPDMSRLQQTIGMLEQLDKVQEANTSGFKANTLTTELIKSKAKELSQQPLDVQMAASEFLGSAFAGAGLTNSFKESDLVSLNKNEQKVAKNIAMWMHLHKDPSIYDYAGSAIKTYLIENPSSVLTMSSANKLTDGLISGARGSNKNLEDTINSYLDQYTIPSEDVPYLRNTMMYMAVAITDNVDKKGNHTTFDASRFETLLDSMYTKKGTSKDSKVFENNNITAEQADSIKERLDKKVNKVYDSLKISSDEISTRVNSDTGKLDILIGGYPATMLGEAGSGELAGTGHIPMSFSLTNKPSGMDQGKYEQSVAIEATAGMMLLPIVNATSNKQSLNYVERYAGVKNVNNIRNDATILFAAMMDPRKQKGYVEFRNNNYAGYIYGSEVPPELMNAIDAIYDNADNATGKYETFTETAGAIAKAARGKSPTVSSVAGYAAIQGAMVQAVSDTVGQVVSGAGKVLDKIDEYGATHTGILGKTASGVSALTGGYARGVFKGRRISEVMSKDELHHCVRYFWNESHSNNKPVTSTNPSLVYSAAPPNYKAKPHEQKNLTYFADVTVPYIKKVTGISNITISSRYRPDTSKYHSKHAEGRGCDIPTDNLTQKQKNALMAELLKVPSIEVMGTSDPELLRIYGHNKSSTNYNPMIKNEADKKDGADVLFGTNHTNHIHITLKDDSVLSGVSGNANNAPNAPKEPPLLSSGTTFVKSAAKTIQQNVNGKVGYIDNRTSTFLPQALPNYTPPVWVMKRMGVSQSAIANNPMLRMTALGSEYCYMKSAFGSGHEDLALAAVAGAKFKVSIIGPTSSSVKVPTKSLTGEQVLKLMQSGELANTYRFTVDTADPHYSYVRNVLRSAKKSNIISVAY